MAAAPRQGRDLGRNAQERQQADVARQIGRRLLEAGDAGQSLVRLLLLDEFLVLGAQGLHAGAIERDGGGEVVFGADMAEEP